MAGKKCPLLKARCLEHGCRWYIQVQGKNPQTGQDLSEWGCAVEWLPVLLIENSQQQRQTGAAVESLRNENVKSARHLAAALVEVANAAITGAGLPGATKDVTPQVGALEHKEH